MRRSRAACADSCTARARVYADSTVALLSRAVLDKFEKRFVNQGASENRDIFASLDLAVRLSLV